MKSRFRVPCKLHFPLARRLNANYRLTFVESSSYSFYNQRIEETDFFLARTLNNFSRHVLILTEMAPRDSHLKLTQLGNAYHPPFSHPRKLGVKKNFKSCDIRDVQVLACAVERKKSIAAEHRQSLFTAACARVRRSFYKAIKASLELRRRHRVRKGAALLKVVRNTRTKEIRALKAHSFLYSALISAF